MLDCNISKSVLNILFFVHFIFKVQMGKFISLPLSILQGGIIGYCWRSWFILLFSIMLKFSGYLDFQFEKNAVDVSYETPSPKIWMSLLLWPSRRLLRTGSR